MKELLKNNKILFGMILGIIFIVSTSVTYAWFSLTVSGNESAKEMTVETGTLSLVFKDGVKIEGINIRPGWSQTKTFTVTNTGTFATEYNIIFKDLINEIERNELVVSYTCTSYTGYVDVNNKGSISGTCSGITSQAVPLSNGLSTIITEDISIDIGITHEYTLTLLFKEMNKDQNYNQGKEIYTEINIVQLTEDIVATRGNIYDVILEDNTTIKEDNIDLFADTAKLYGRSGLFRTTLLDRNEDADGDGTGEEVLYFRGLVKNNFLVFANQCWRIVRTNESGESIKLSYGGTPKIIDNKITCPQSTESVGITIDETNTFSYSYNRLFNEAKYIKWIHQEGMDSNAKTQVEAWYIQNIEALGKHVSNLIVDEPFCNDISLVGTTYGTYDRLVTNKSPQYKCPQESDKYTVGSGKLNKPIALLTADEVAYAGGVYDVGNKSYFLYSPTGYWTMSPAFYNNYYALSWFVHNTGELYYLPAQQLLPLVPVISLSNYAMVAEGGTGVYNNPYIVITN